MAFPHPFQTHLWPLESRNYLIVVKRGEDGRLRGGANPSLFFSYRSAHLAALSIKNKKKVKTQQGEEKGEESPKVSCHFPFD